MKIIEPGHIYQLEHRDGSGASLLVFVNRETGTEHEGTQTQEVIKALIDRTKHCDACLRWEGNDKIIEHLRMALVLHEARALERKTEKGELAPERVPTGADGHFVLRFAQEQYARHNKPMLGEPRTTDYCKACGESPDSATHLHEHAYEDPREA